jgi:hypothetical protein
MTFDDVRQIALALPGVEEGTSYGTPSFKVKGKFLSRLREDDENLVLRIDFLTREALMQSNPEIYHITDHYRDYPAVLIRLDRADEAEVRELFDEAWRQSAPKRLVAQHTPQP